MAGRGGVALARRSGALAGSPRLCSYLGVAVGDLASGTLSQVLKSRRRAVFVFLALTVLTTAAYFRLGPRSRPMFYGVRVALGVSTGYWALFVTMASEQFGTNLLATALEQGLFRQGRVAGGGEAGLRDSRGRRASQSGDPGRGS